jgi:hypothetical protein
MPQRHAGAEITLEDSDRLATPIREHGVSHDQCPQHAVGIDGDTADGLRAAAPAHATTTLAAAHAATALAAAHAATALAALTTTHAAATHTLGAGLAAAHGNGKNGSRDDSNDGLKTTSARRRLHKEPHPDSLIPRIQVSTGERLRLQPE